MRILLIYASIEGQTRKIAGFIADRLAAIGHKVDRFEAGGEAELPDPAQFDSVMVAAPLHMGHFPMPLRRLVKRNASALMARPGAFVTVSLAAASADPGEVEEVGAIVEAFSQETGWWPVSVHHSAGALKYTEYDFFRRWMLKRIAAKEGGPTDTSRDHEFTDWDKLEHFVSSFAADVPSVAGKL